VSISSTFYKRLLRQYFCAKKLKSQNVTKEKLSKALLYKKFVVRKMLMKLGMQNQSLLFCINPDKTFLEEQHSNRVNAENALKS